MGNSSSRRMSPEDLIEMANAAENDRAREKVALKIVAFIQNDPSQKIFLENRSVLVFIKKREKKSTLS